MTSLTKANRRITFAMRKLKFEDDSIDDLEWNASPEELKWVSIEKDQLIEKKYFVEIDPWVDGVVMVKGVVYFIHQVKLIDGKFASALLKSLFSSDVINDDLVVNEGRVLRCIELDSLLPELPTTKAFKDALHYMYFCRHEDTAIPPGKIASLLVCSHLLRIKQLFMKAKEVLSSIIHSDQYILKETLEHIRDDLASLPNTESAISIKEAIELLCDSAASVNSTEAARESAKQSRRKRMSIVISKLNAEKQQAQNAGPRAKSRHEFLPGSEKGIAGKTSSTVKLGGDEIVRRALADHEMKSRSVDVIKKEVEALKGSNDNIENSMTVHVDHAYENGDSWETHYSENHGAYYVYNSATHETRWLS